MSHIGTGTIIFYKTIVAVLLILAVVAYSDTTFVCGNISGVWDAGGSPYCVVCDVHVPSGDTLIIMPDVKVVFMANFGFYVDSRAVLKAMGTISRPIIFTTADTSIFHKAINFNNSAPGCTLQYCRIDRGKKEGYKADGGGIYCYNSSPVISNNTISGNLVAWEDYGGRGGGIYCYAASPTIINNTITGNSATYDGSGGGIYCYGGNPTIYGNTISGNTAYDGGGIHCDGGNPTIINNTIFDNPANIGGGIYCYNNTPTIADNTIYENSAGNGGGIYCDYCNPTISDNIIYENWAGYYGGGIYCGDGGSIISNNSIYGNTGSSGAGIYCGEGSPTISGNTIFDNSAGGSGGGGIFCLGGYPKMIGNSIFRNTTSGSGGGIYCRYYCCSEIINNTILKNSAGSFGGGINYDKSNATLICNTISANSADSRGGAICCEDSTNIVLFNTIIWNNTAPIGTELSINYSLGSPCTAVIAYSDIELSKCFIQNNSKIVWDNSNVNSNPFFADTLYHLSDSSNCIDAGAESVFIAVRDSFIFAPDSDFEDDPRPRGLAWDIGADESPYTMSRIRYRAGWNLVSNPTAQPFATAITGLPYYEYDCLTGSYFDADTLFPGKGYWLVASDIGTINIKGGEETYTDTLYPGWNLIGSIKHPIPSNLITTDPPGLSLGPLYKYDKQTGSYSVTDSLLPGVGYWLLSKGHGRIITGL